ncbi:hypothetical protein [Streptomyces sp. WMMC940]|uniref:hypothetical protein n=1 Tax=Streptomyces sp. WMMC940 TaxID=3015153 RepID=UPI0022B66BC8|nr:hypothetical protein [Streptomyces sp. WMMC940]MCZ7456230.1 hypothetical protein [Streptomyces sp. WMMC940]
MYVVLRQVWSAVRPVTAQQRFLWWCGALLLASGAVHAVVAALDWAPWSGAVSWRKPVVFGMSFGVLSWSAVWVMRQLPVRRWGWLPASLLGTGSVVEVALITMQRWRGEASHFNQKPAFDVIFDWSNLIYFAAALWLAQAGFLVAWAIDRRRRVPEVYPGSEEYREALASVDDGTAFNLKYWRVMSTTEQAEFDERQLATSDGTQPVDTERFQRGP